MNPLANPEYLLPPLLAAAASWSLCVIVARRALRSVHHRYFALFLLAVGLSSLLIYMMRSSPTPGHAIVWEHALLPVMMLSALVFYHFATSYTRRPRHWLAGPVSGAYVVVVFGAAAAGLLVDRMELQGYGYAPVFQPAFYPLVAWGYLWTALGFVSIYRAQRASRVYEERNRLLWILIAATLPLIGSALDILPSLYPAAILGNLGFAAITIFAMRRYHLLDIGLALQKGLAYFIVSTVVALPYVTIILVATSLTRDLQYQIFIIFPMLVVLALGLQPLWNRVQVAVDKSFFRHRWDLFRTLEEFTRRSRSIAELERPVHELAEMLLSTLQANGVALLMPDQETGVFVPAATAGREDLSTLRLSPSSLIVRWLERERRPLQHHELDLHPQLQALSDREQEVLEDAGVDLFVPLSLRDRLVGVLALGPKLAERPYTCDELRLLGMVSTQAGVLLDDARLYQAIRSQLEQSRRRLEAFQAAARKMALEEDPRQALQGLVDTARSLLGARYVSMRVWGPLEDLQHEVVPADDDGAGPGPADLTATINQRSGAYGALHAVRKVEGNIFTADDERLLNLFAVLAEVLLENVQLHSTVVEERASLAAIQSSMAEGLIVLDPRSRVIYLNQVAASFLACREEDAVGKPLTDALHAWSPDEKTLPDLELFIQDLQGQATDITTVEVALQEPEQRELALTSFPITGGPREPMTGVLLRDITREREQERRRDVFVSVASHQLRTPMAIISGFAELLLRRDLNESVKRDSLERIYRNTQVVVSVVDDLLNLTRIQTGRLSLNLDRIGLEDLGEEVAGNIRRSTERHEITVAPMPGVPSVVADREKLAQVLTNLLENAVKYSPEGGPITVSARHEPGRERVVLAISDSGIGIAPEDHEYLFTIFHRVQRPETIDIKGTGLGLYIVKQLVELMHGEIWVESELHQGSTFYVALPTVYQNSENWVEGR